MKACAVPLVRSAVDRAALSQLVGDIDAIGQLLACRGPGTSVVTGTHTFLKQVSEGGREGGRV